MSHEFQVEPLSDEPAAIKATENTLRMMDADARLERREDKWFVVFTRNTSYLRFACEQQGYVRRVVDEPPQPRTGRAT